MIEYLLTKPPQFLIFVFIALAATAAISFHEFAHARVAAWLGDPTGRLTGRMTLNPKRHLDPFGSFMVLIAGFGWGKPVPVAPNRLRSRRGGRIWVALAGPLANAALAILAALLIRLAKTTSISAGIVVEFLAIAVAVNVVFAVFNLLPIPPLDGFPILAELLPPSRSEVIFFLERWGFLILLVTGLILFRPVFGPALARVTAALLRLAGAA